MDPGGGLVRVSGRDLTIDDLVYLNRMTTVGQVLPTVAHELNNALQVVGGLVEMLSSRPDLAGDALEKVRKIGVQANRASTMMRDLVSFSRRDEGGVHALDLAKIAERALSMRRYHLARARISIGLDAGAAGAFVLRTDGHAVLQVLLNLLINAELGVAGRDGAQIQVTLRDRKDEVDLEVRDNGRGVAPEIRDRVGQPFFTTREPAAGLGLVVANALLALGDGRLQLTYPPDGGTLAVMTLRRPPPTD
jgi:C4-dicarboxylate-specific signal transduction histidine kinase